MRMIFLTGALLALAACGQGHVTRTSMAVSDVWCRPTPNGAAAGACYATLKAGQDDRLVSINTPAAGSATVHDMSMDGGMMKMSEMTDGLPLEARKTVNLAPGGKHIMLTGLSGPLVAGAAVPLTLTFDKAEPVTVDAAVRQTAAGGHLPTTRSKHEESDH